MKWFAENWMWFAPLVLSEALPFLPTQANGMIQAAINVLRKIGEKR